MAPERKQGPPEGKSPTKGIRSETQISNFQIKTVETYSQSWTLEIRWLRLPLAVGYSPRRAV